MEFYFLLKKMEFFDIIEYIAVWIDCNSRNYS
jgi:hypothetical protein